MITIRNLTYSYKKSKRKNLDNLSVDFLDSTINLVIGKNGCGKTTLFDLIAGVMKRPKEITGVPEDRDIIYQLQGLMFPNSLKGKDLFRFYLYTNHSNVINVTNKPYVDEFMSESEKELMERVWNTDFGHLSMGERRYLCILATTLMTRKLYIFDEPTSGVDPEARIQILRRIEKLAEQNCMVLLSSHTLHDLENVKCKIHLLHHGKFTFQGSYAEFIASGESDNPDITFLDNVR